MIMIVYRSIASGTALRRTIIRARTSRASRTQRTRWSSRG